jgi:hypothetical protein
VTSLATAIVPGFVVSPSDVVHLRVQAFGSSPTALRATVWLNDEPVPTGWLIDVVDSTASLQGAGGVGVHAYLSSSSSGSAVLLVDDLVVDNA